MARRETDPRVEETSAANFLPPNMRKTIHGIVAGAPPAIDLAAEKRLIDCLVKLASEKAILSAHDVSDGGLAVTLAESCFRWRRRRASSARSQHRSAGQSAAEAALFGERGARAVVSRFARIACPRAAQLRHNMRVQARQIGSRHARRFRIQYKGCPVIQGAIAFAFAKFGLNRWERPSRTHER